MNLVGEGALVTGVLPDVFPTIDVESLETDGWALSGWRPAWGGAAILGAAGERPHIQLFNPVGSEMLTVIEQIMISSNAAGRVEFNIHDAQLATNEVSERWRDRRFPTLNFPVTQVKEESIVGTPIVAPLNIRVLANVTVVIEPPKGIMVLAPGTGVAFSQAANAVELDVSFFWRERPADPAELNISG